MEDSRQEAKWTFLTNHAHVLISLVREPACSLREVASKVGITERAVQRIIRELEAGGYITRTREGRSNRYHMDLDRELRHPVESNCRLRELINLIQ